MEILWEIPVEDIPLYPLTITIKENNNKDAYSFYHPKDKEVLRKIKEHIDHLEQPHPKEAFAEICPRAIASKQRMEDIPHFANKILRKGFDDPRYEAFRDRITHYCINLIPGEEIKNRDIRGKDLLDIDYCTDGDGIRSFLGLLVCRGIMERSEFNVKTIRSPEYGIGHTYRRSPDPQVCQWLQKSETGKFVCMCPLSLITKIKLKK